MLYKIWLQLKRLPVKLENQAYYDKLIQIYNGYSWILNEDFIWMGRKKKLEQESYSYRSRSEMVEASLKVGFQASMNQPKVIVTFDWKNCCNNHSAILKSS
jgi:hypothetical protein